jgi:hypothetical protein
LNVHLVEENTDLAAMMRPVVENMFQSLPKNAPLFFPLTVRSRNSNKVVQMKFI